VKPGKIPDYKLLAGRRLLLFLKIVEERLAKESTTPKGKGG
jgi:hypothetical protein